MPTGLPQPADKPLLDIYASIVVDLDSRKGMVIGHRAAGLKLALQPANSSRPHSERRSTSICE